MSTARSLLRAAVATLLGCAALNGHAADTTMPDPSIPYYSWYEVTLPESTGASCGNGTPMRFYINRAQSDNLLYMMEPGGACWDYGTCTQTSTGAEAGLGGFNPDGIPHNYMNGTANQSLLSSFLSPLLTRMDLAHILVGEPKVETQQWTQVFVPYCTGDIHMGSAVRNYTSPSGDWRLQHYSGLKNIQAVAQWLTSHGFGKPNRLLVYGMSAGGYGTLANYATLRNTLQPQAHSSLLDDAGTVFNTPFDADAATHPSVGLYDRVRTEWGMTGPDGMITVNSRLTRHFDPGNMGSAYAALSATFPHDRFGFSSYQRDKIIAAYHYRAFVPAVIAAPDDATKDTLSLAMFAQELDGLKQTLNPLPNFGYFMPWARNDFIDNHQVTAVSFTGSGIHERGIDADIGTFVDNLLNQQDPADTPVMKAFRTQQGSDFTFSTFLAWIDSIFNLTGEAGPISGHRA
ncbi:MULTISPECIES: pectin acetylesterase-family hydrolase [Burkholderia]|uniref:pectin acetylesterase-family hydrolase n=1 Tax=Burkholderia TaxID=32008 RepID=UPI000B7A6BE5|nr:MULTISPECIES: pectin acetylesterase-family hydrolase [Burkholderia]MBY4725664.1 pectinacetylesterase family protein [Burkholderia contaminans]MCI3968048.1 pectinacetylesterase family protein [Burkholderia sp. HI4860]MDN7788449.1 pectin acetylesterase-family hydrolase [Burkholderia contaminans]OXI97533.1 pectinacetylesterase [Burkholderia sp. AU33647]